MLIPLAMVCSCQKQNAAAEQQLAQRKAELDTREKALDEREKALAEREKPVARAAMLPAGLQLGALKKRLFECSAFCNNPAWFIAGRHLASQG